MHAGTPPLRSTGRSMPTLVSNEAARTAIGSPRPTTGAAGRDRHLPEALFTTVGIDNGDIA